VKHLDGVYDANVNFGASKLTVFGDTTIEELEKAGAFENLKIIPEEERFEEKQEPFFKKHSTVLASIGFLLIGWFAGQMNGEESVSSILAYGASMLVGGYRLFTTGLKNLIRLQFDMKTLMTIAVIGAAFIGEWGEGATVVILFAISEVLESFSMDKARASIRSLMSIAPKEAQIRRNGTDMLVPVDEIEIGDIMLLKPGQKLAMDGVVVKGSSSINQAAITGESVPVNKEVGDEVFAGTLNEEGALEVKVTKRAEDTTIAKIIHLVEEAQAERAPTQQFVDRFAKYYTPIIIVIALTVVVVPPLLFSGDWNEWIYRGLAVLVVGCPCALVISTPVTIVTAIGNAARNGVLIKGGVHLEQTGALSAIAFDKTGTLTKGVPEVTDLLVLTDKSKAETLKIAGAIESLSQHPVAVAIVKKAKAENLNFNDVPVDDFQSITGKGAKAVVEGIQYYIGSPTLFNELGYEIESNHEKVMELQEQGKTVMMLGTSSVIVAIIAVADDVRKVSRDVLQRLHKIGIKKTIMLTGDNQATADAIGKRLGISDVKAELMPEDKLKAIKELRNNYGEVAMVGDGVNDAPALAASTVGIAMGGAGTDTALETADIVLMADDLSKLPFTIKLSRKALQNIKQNITFAIGIKVLALLLIVPGWLTLWMAIFADMGATLIVTLNSLRLLRVKD
jgi:Zn2+/Cd2+-exporting ATPase